MKSYISKVKFLTLVGAAALTLASCGDFLLIEPKTFVSDDNFWNEKADVEQMVAGVYTKLQASAVIERCIVWGEVRSDNTAEGLNVANDENLYRTLKENLRANNVYTDWASFYKVINAANIVIERAPQVAEKDPTYTPSQVKATIAEMKAIRSLCMFYLVRAFKDVPYPTHAFQAETDMEPMPAHNGDSIVRVLISDLEGCVGDALRKYPKDEDRDHNSNCNRITQNAIYALLCDLCLWNGDYNKVVNYAEKVITAKHLDFEEDYSNNVNQSSGGRPVIFRWDDDVYDHNGRFGYPLYPCYSGTQYGSNFNSIFGDGNSFESIFELAFTPLPSGGSYLSNGAVHLYGNREGSSMSEGKIFAHENVVSDIANDIKKVYDHKYDVRHYTNTEPDAEYSKGYPAKYVSSSVDLTVRTDNPNLPYQGRYSGSSRADRNWIFYRLTDVMLMEAEALVELGGNDLYMKDELDNPIVDDENNPVLDKNLHRAFSLVWTVNRRSLMTPHYANANSVTAPLVLKIDKFNSKSEMRELVMKERRRELMFEGKRWFDLLRRCHREGKPDYIRSQVPAKGNGGGSVTLFLNYESLFWPYNKTELKSNTALTQKPFYGGSNGEDKEYQSSVKK